MNQAKRYWFPMKRYGWGWGLPLVWQGWVALALYIALLFVGIAIFPPATHPDGFAAVVLGSTAAFVGVCYLKGEPPRWRWGD